MTQYLFEQDYCAIVLSFGKRTAMEPECYPATDLGHRDWGTEHLIGLSPGKWMAKLLTIKQGCKGGLQYHNKKDEGVYIINGELLVRYLDVDSGNLSSKIFTSGDFIRFPPGFIHQEEAVTDVSLLEVSTPHLNDRVRVESDFGIECTDGLPSTSLDEIIEL